MSDSMQRPMRRSSRLALSIVATGLLILATSASVAATSPNTSTGSGSTNPGPSGDGATRINPDPSVRQLHRQAWDHVSVSANGKRLVVYFWMGVEDCNGLGRVDVSRHNGQLIIKLWTGIPKGAEHMICPELAQLYKTVVHLNRPIIGGGS